MIQDYLPHQQGGHGEKGLDQCDFVYVSGDAYVDHPSFGTAIISRLLEARGYRVGIIPQPDWKDPDSINVLGRPPPGLPGVRRQHGLHGEPLLRFKKRRSQDAYTPGGEMESGRTTPPWSTAI